MSRIKVCAICRRVFKMTLGAKTAETRTLCHPCRDAVRAKMELAGAGKPYTK
jgi:hypothetical protein